MSPCASTADKVGDVQGVCAAHLKARRAPAYESGDAIDGCS